MASISRGSLIGKGGWLAYSFKKRHASNPIMKAQQPTSNHSHCQGNPSGCKTGIMLKDRSTQCMSHAQPANATIYGNTLLTSMRSRARNGRKKWPKMMTMPTHHQVPFSRTTYQNVSSGMLPFQIMKY